VSQGHSTPESSLTRPLYRLNCPLRGSSQPRQKKTETAPAFCRCRCRCRCPASVLCPVVPISERKSGLISVDDSTRTPQTFAAALRKAFKASVTRPASTHLAVAFPLISRDLSPFVAGITLQPVHIRPACVAIEVFRWRAKVIFVVCARKVKIGFARHVQAAERRSILHARRAPRELRPCNGFTDHLVHRTFSIIVYFR